MNEKVAQLRKKEVYRLFAAGLTDSEIEKVTDIPRQTVYSWRIKKNAEFTIVDMVIADLQARELAGQDEYGIPLLQDNNKAEWLREAYEEALDYCIYLRLGIERWGNGQETGSSEASGN